MTKKYKIEWRDTSTRLREPYIDDEPASFDAVRFAEEANRLLDFNAELIIILETALKENSGDGNLHLYLYSWQKDAREIIAKWKEM